MVRQPTSGDTGPPKAKRSRNGCNECRRLHRRCDEGKPECQNCKDGGKTCSYNRTLSWGGRPFNKSPFRTALEGGVGEILTGASLQGSPRSFVYGQIQDVVHSGRSHSQVRLTRTRSDSGSVQGGRINEQLSAWSTPPGTPSSSAEIPWLSEHHRMLFNHFTEKTLYLFHSSPVIRTEIKSVMIPMATDTNHGFSLLAAILSLASTHRFNLGISSDTSEIDYWRDMSIGHLRRPGVQEDGSTENVFAATALILCIRDAISDGERPLSWRLHLQGASTILRKVDVTLSSTTRETRRLMTKLAIGLQLRSLLPVTSTAGLDKMREETKSDGIGLMQKFIDVLKEIRALRLERLALEAIESNSDSKNMSPLWSSLQVQCLQTICDLERVNSLDAKYTGGRCSVHSLYGHAAMLQVYSGVLKLRLNDTGLRRAVDEAMAMLRKVVDHSAREFCVMLVWPLFTIGCLVRDAEDKGFVGFLLGRITREHGKANAGMAGVLLEEIWRRAELNDALVVQAELDELTGAQGWDLSLW